MKLTAPDIKNGQIWESPSMLRAITQWIDADRWLLLGTPDKAVHGGCCMVPMSDPDPPHRLIYTKAELEARLLRNGWRLVDHLRIVTEVYERGDV